MRRGGMSVSILLLLTMHIFATESIQMANLSSQPTKLVKTKNVDIALKCLLLDRHEEFNQNSNVTWFFKRTCKGSCHSAEEDDEWSEICGSSCKTSLNLGDEASNGFYLCKISPYHISTQTVLQIEVTKTFKLEIFDPMMGAPPEIVSDSSSEFNMSLNSQLVLQCKAKSSQKPTVKWFKKKDDGYVNSEDHTFESYKTFMETSRSIKYFENFYEPMVSTGLKELSDNLYLSKLIVNNITQNSVYVCVAINYFGFSYHENVLRIPSKIDSSDSAGESVLDFPERKYDILFLIPVLLLMPISVLICTILYLLINRQILRSRNKSPANV